MGAEASAKHKRGDPKEVGNLEASSVLCNLLILGHSLAPPQPLGLPQHPTEHPHCLD